MNLLKTFDLIIDFFLKNRALNVDNEKDSLIAKFILLTGVNLILIFPIIYVIDIVIGLSLLVAGVVYIFLNFLFFSTLKSRYIVELFLLIVCLHLSFLIVKLGGIQTVVCSVLLLLPIVANLLNGFKSSLIWVAISIFIIIVLPLLPISAYTIQLQQSQWIVVNIVSNFCLIGLSMVFIYLFDTDRIRAYKELDSKNASLTQAKEELLQNLEEITLQSEEIAKQRDFIVERNKLLEEKDLKISQSIEAAKYIQEAILPYKAKLTNLLGEYFIINKPRDVVSGDFYWLNEVDGRTIFAVVDCTGHGVPGAFMTMICNTLLDKIVRVWHITQPDEILEKLNAEIKTVLNSEFTENQSGMDLGIVNMIKQEDGSIQVQYSGAKIPLLVLLPNSPVPMVLEGTKRIIGSVGQNSQLSFVLHELRLEKGSKLYLTTDGFLDQNDINRIRFGKKHWVELISKLYDNPFNLQSKTIEDAFQAHKGNAEQRDDILVVGYTL